MSKSQAFSEPPKYDHRIAFKSLLVGKRSVLILGVNEVFLRTSCNGEVSSVCLLLSLRRPHSTHLAQDPAQGYEVGLDRERAALMTGQWSASWDLPDILRLEDEEQHGDALHSGCKAALHTSSRQYDNFNQ